MSLAPPLLRTVLRWTNSSAASSGCFHIPLSYVEETRTLFLTLPRDVKADGTLALPLAEGSDDVAVKRLAATGTLTSTADVKRLALALFRANAGVGGGAKEEDAGFDALRALDGMSEHLRAQKVSEIYLFLNYFNANMTEDSTILMLL